MNCIRHTYLILLLLLTGLSAYAFAASPLHRFTISELANHDISQQLAYYSVSQNTLPAPDLLTDLPGWLRKLSPHSTVSTFGDHYLSVFEVYNDTRIEQWYLYPYGSVIDQVTVLIYDNSRIAGKPLSIISGHAAVNAHDFHYGAGMSVLPGQSKTIVMIFQSDYFFAPIKILLQPYSQLSKQFELENVLLLVSLGMCLTLGLYNLFIFWQTREYQYLNYTLSTLAYAIGWASVFGLPEFIGLGSSTFLLMPSYIIGAFFSCYFYRQFLHSRLKDDKVLSCFKLIAWACLLSLPVAFYSPGSGHYLASLLTSAALFVGLYGGLKAWRQGYTPARYLTVALLAVLLPNSVGNMMNLGLLPAYNINIYLMGLLGNSLDSLLLAFALAAKFRTINLQNFELTHRLEQTVRQRTEELIQANLQLEQSNSELLEASLAKRRFLATISHEIRTPLTSIIGYADGILMGDIDKSEQERVTRIIAENGSHLLAVVNDILDISKIEANKLEFESLPTPLFAVLAQIESIVGKRARDKGLAFHLDYQFPLPAHISTDPTRLKQILFNLTNNALKFTEQGFIGLSVKIEQGQLLIIVKDSGEGLSDRQLEQLFEPFTQADNLINRRKGGTGLGLSISQRLARGLGGIIEVDSTPRKGSSFSLKIPLNVVDKSAWIHSAGEIWQATPSQVVKPVTLPNFAGNKVLLADDHPSNRELIAILLRRMNISVTEVENGQKVLDTLFYQKFDLLLLDIHMPLLDGTEALRQLRTAGNNTPAIALTANSLKHEIQHYLRLGFSDHLAKPISRHHFVTKLSQYLSHHGALESPLHHSDMLALTNDYQQDLIEQIARIESAWQQRDITLISELAHRIKDSASSFGFDLVSRKFAEIEASALQDDEIALSYSLPQSIHLCRQCSDLPKVNIPLGIVNHRNSVEQLLLALYQLTDKAEFCLQDMHNALENNELNSVLVFLHGLQPDIQRCGLSDTLKVCEQLEQGLTQGNSNRAAALTLLNEIKTHFSQLAAALSPKLVGIN